MARDKKDKKDKKKDKETDPAPTDGDEGTPRPGTSGTENLLMTTRKDAAQQFQKAQRAEHSYRAKKRATAAQQDYKDAKGHFKESAHQFKTGFKKMFGAIKSIPYIYGQKRDERRKAKNAASKKKLEERLAKQTGDGDTIQEPEE